MNEARKPSSISRVGQNSKFTVKSAPIHKRATSYQPAATVTKKYESYGTNNHVEGPATGAYENIQTYKEKTVFATGAVEKKKIQDFGKAGANSGIRYSTYKEHGNTEVHYARGDYEATTQGEGDFTRIRATKSAGADVARNSMHRAPKRGSKTVLAGIYEKKGKR